MRDDKNIRIFAGWIENENQIGTLYVSSSRGKDVYSFEFSDSWLYNFSHIMLDPDLYNSRGRQFVSADKLIWGFISDSLPDRWGRKLLKRKEEILAKEQGRTKKDLTELDFLLGVNDESRMGGLRFKDSYSEKYLSANDSFNIPPLEALRKLEQASLQLEKEEFQNDKWLKVLLAPGSSLGGARPKATVKDESGQLWIAKFPSNHDEYDTGAWEKTTSDLARLSGLNVPETKQNVFSPKGTTFMAKRFDRLYGGSQVRRVHYASALTLLGKVDGANHNDGSSYLDMADFIKNNSIQPKKDLEELWNRIVFSILVSNTDDHLRNHDFILTENGWKLSPLFDVNPNPIGNELSLNITEDNNLKNLSLALDTAKYYDLPFEKAKENAIRIATVVKDNWEKMAKRNGCSPAEIESMRSAFEDKGIYQTRRNENTQKMEIDRYFSDYYRNS